MQHQTRQRLQLLPSDQLWRNSIAGWAAGLCSVIIGMPFDICKVRIQTANSGMFLKTLVSIVKTERPSSLWRGCFFPLMTSGVCTSFVFTTFTHLKTAFAEHRADLKSWGSDIYLSGGLAGAAGSILYCPVEHIRIRMQMQGLNKYYSNSFDCLAKLIRTHGVKSLYRGFWVTFTRDFFWMSNYFFTFEKLKEYNPSGNKALIFLSGGLSGIAGWTGCFILDNIKSKLQADSLEKPLYKSARQILREASFRQLRAGYTVGIYRGIFVSATTLGVFQCVSDKLAGVNGSQDRQ